MFDAISDDLVVGSIEGPFVEDGLDEGSLAGLVIFPGGGDRQIGEAGELGIGGIKEVVNAPAASVGLISGDVHHASVVVHFRDPSVESYLHRGDGHGVEVVNVVEHGEVIAECLGQDLFDPRHVEGADHRVVLFEFFVGSDFDPRDAGGFAILVGVIDDFAASGGGADFDSPIVEVFQDGVVQAGLRTPLEHPEDAGLGPDGEEHEDGEHAPRRDVIAVHESQGVGDGVPHPVQRAATAPQPREPLREGNVVQVAHHVHAPVEIEERPHDGRRPQPHRVVELVLQPQLLRPRKGLQTRHRSPDGKSKVQAAQRPPLVDEGVHVFLHPQLRVETARPLHDPEEVVVAAEEDVQAHLDVVALLVFPAGDLAADEGAEFEHLHVVAGVGEVHGRDHPGEAGAHDADFEFGGVGLARAVLGAGHEVLVEEGVVADLAAGGFRLEVGGRGGGGGHGEGRGARGGCGGDVEGGGAGEDACR